MAFNQSALRNYFQRQKQPISGQGKTTAFVNDLDSFITFDHESVVYYHESGQHLKHIKINERIKMQIDASKGRVACREDVPHATENYCWCYPEDNFFATFEDYTHGCTFLFHVSLYAIYFLPSLTACFIYFITDESTTG